MFERVKDEILAIGFDEILEIPRATDPRTDLAVAVLNDAGMKDRLDCTFLLMVD